MEAHVRRSGSPLGKKLIDTWGRVVPRFDKVMPVEYRRVLQARRAASRPRAVTGNPLAKAVI